MHILFLPTMTIAMAAIIHLLWWHHFSSWTALGAIRYLVKEHMRKCQNYITPTCLLGVVIFCTTVVEAIFLHCSMYIGRWIAQASTISSALSQSSFLPYWLASNPLKLGLEKLEFTGLLASGTTRTFSLQSRWYLYSGTHLCCVATPPNGVYEGSATPFSSSVVL